MADCNHLILELKNHEKLEENTDPLISKLRQKGLLHEDVSGSTVHDRAEQLLADLNQATSDGYSESFLGDLLDVLKTFSGFDDIVVKFRTNAELKKPQQVTQSDIGIPFRHLDTLTVGPTVDLVLKSEQEKSPELFSKVEEQRHDLYQASTGTSAQEESHKIVDSFDKRIQELTEECEMLRLQKESAEERARYAERKVRRDREKKSTSDHLIRNLWTNLNKLKSELEEARTNSQLKDEGLEKVTEKLKKAEEKVATLQIRVNELEAENSTLMTKLQLKTEENSSPATSPILQLKLFRKDVKPTGKKPLGSGCYGSVIEVKYNSSIYAAKKFRGDLELEIRNFEEKLNTEFGILLQLEHDHIVRYIGFTILQDSEFPVLLMEKLAKSLHAYLECESECEHIIPLAQKVHILLGVGKGLRYLHEKDVLHRDLTARNVLLDQSNPPIPKIADFGNSHITSINPIYERDSSVGFPGTLLYMPPEACKKNGRHSKKLDIFSFGHLSLFVCTQMFPSDLLDSTYARNCEDGTEEIRGRSEVDRRQTYFAKLDDEQYRPLKALMFKCLDNNAAKRPSASEVICELNEIHALLESSDNVDFPNDGDDYEMPLQETHDSIPDIN